MRIIAGKHRGSILADVGAGDAAAHLRPTSDRVRESLFSMLTHLSVIHNARVLDLFAGTGALGLEALSRGAMNVTFVENGRIAQKLIAQNVKKLHVEHSTHVLRSDATALGAFAGDPINLVFLDPPYGKRMGQAALAAVRTGGWLAKGAVIVWEENAPMDAPEGFTRTDRRKYGDTHVTILKVD